MTIVSWSDRRRKWKNNSARAVLFLLAMAAIAPFVLIVWYVIQQGVPALNWSFFTELPKGPGDGSGGIANAIQGSLIVVGFASLIGVPWGLMTGIYLSEYSYARTAHLLRLVLDLLNSVPSIIVGIFVYGIFVRRFGFSAWSGSVALAILLLPVVARSSEEVLKLMPTHIREAGLALGLPRWQVVMRIILPGCRSALLTGVMLAVARIFGETAPLLFTALGNQFFAHSLNQPTATISLQIYNLARSGFADLERQAWAAALVLVILVISLNLFTRLLLSRPFRAR